MASWMDYAMEKLKEVLVIIQSFCESLISKADEVFPPETREEKIRHWIHLATPYMILGVVLLLVVCCCRCCCCRRRGSGGMVKMMKAPGRNYRMPRHTFESDPRSYFRGLRGKSIDELV